MNLVIFIIIISIVLLSVLFQKELLHQINKNGPYRLADLILYPQYLCDKNTKYMLDKYPDSIGVKYMIERFPCIKKLTKECESILEKAQLNNSIDTKLLTNIIKTQSEYKQYSKSFSNNELVLHIRIGDVLCSPDKKWSGSKTMGQIYAKYGDDEWWDKVKNYVGSNNINTIYLVYGSHTNTCLKESYEYIATIKKKMDCNVVEVNKNTADQDLMFCINAKHFITTGGGYGLLIGELVQKNGGNFALKPERTTGTDNDNNNIHFI